MFARLTAIASPLTGSTKSSPISIHDSVPFPDRKVLQEEKPLPPTPGLRFARAGSLEYTEYDQQVPPTPGLKPSPPSIAQLALPSPEETSPSSSSNTSHEPSNLNELVKYGVSSPKRPNRLRKKAPPSSYPFSFIPDDPSPTVSFPYAFHRSSPTSRSSSFISPPSRSMSVNGIARITRKLTKRRPSSSEPTDAAVPDDQNPRFEEDQPGIAPLQRRSTFNFGLGRRRSSVTTNLGTYTQSEDGHYSLPPVKRAGRSALNIPTFQLFQTTRRDSWHAQSASQPNVPSSPSAVGTDALSEVPWTGVVSKALDVQTERNGWKSTWSLSLDDGEHMLRPKPRFTLGDESESPRSSSPTLSSRPPLLRRHAVVTAPKRRWTLAMALTDEGISDELLVEKLEALRSRSRVGSVVEADDWDSVWAAYNDELEEDDSQLPLPTSKEFDNPSLPPIRTTSMPVLPSSTTATWQSARRALLTCRELVRTERHYLSSLQTLLTGGTRMRPPPLMHAYAVGLAVESAGLLRRMESDPSAWGVAAAFLGAEESLEAALVAWCGVVGAWFSDEKTESRTSKRLSKTRAPDSSISESAAKDEEPRLSWRRSSLTASIRTLSKPSAPPDIPPVVPAVPLKVAIPTAEQLSAMTPSPSSSSKKSGKEKDLRPNVRDLAIAPTQRVMRYVLLYRDLLDHTPAYSAARPLVSQALDTAMRIAQRCDRAQGNSAFLRTMSGPPSYLTNLFAPNESEAMQIRPRVTLTFAQSLDAKIAGALGAQLILSGKESMVMTHWLRTMHDGILVGIGTALNDDPQLNSAPLRICLAWFTLKLPALAL
ncbi:unnamed protein product [Mycena citricolor]|uniref:2,5-diamino-6-ribosylamino-4(3H)-pyrimidinone 5'-phosphate reductase n=1 Tax=Mycena citricolor TaxID=2018698 RepID=A0AAD2K628_9AGAR|nr:unnamed protein product [Mycena citricolor]